MLNRIESKLTKLAAIFKGKKMGAVKKTPCDCCACGNNQPVETSRLYVQQMARANASCNNRNTDGSLQCSSINGFNCNNREQKNSPAGNFTITSSSSTAQVIKLKEKIQSPTPTEDKEESETSQTVPEMQLATENETGSKQKHTLKFQPENLPSL